MNDLQTQIVKEKIQKFMEELDMGDRNNRLSKFLLAGIGGYLDKLITEIIQEIEKTKGSNPMALENVGRLSFGDAAFVLLNDGRVLDINSNPVGTYVNNDDATVTLNDSNGDLWATVSHDGTNFVLTGADGTTTSTANWTADPQWSGNYSGGYGTTGDINGNIVSSDFSTNTALGTFTFDDVTYQMVSDGTSTVQLWAGGTQAGYAVPGREGFYNIYAMDDVPVCSMNLQTGAIMGKNGSPMGTISEINGEPFTPQTQDTPTQGEGDLGTVTFYDPTNDQMATYTMRNSGLYDAEGGYAGSYETTGPNQYQFFSKEHTLLGDYNSATGAFTGADGTSVSAHFAPSGGNALPDVSQVPGPWSRSESKGTSYSGLGSQYRANVDQWMSDLSASMTPEAFQNLISGAYSKAAGQTSKAYDTAGNEIPGLYQTAQEQVGQAYEAAQSYLPEIYQQTLTPALQSGVNTLAKKNMLDSTVAGSTMAGAANLAYQSVLPHQAQLAGQQAGALTNLAGQQAGAGTQLAGQQAGALSQLAGQEAQYQTAYPATLGGMIGNLGKYSATQSTSKAEGQDQLAPYRLVYGTLPHMSQWGTS